MNTIDENQHMASDYEEDSEAEYEEGSEAEYEEDSHDSEDSEAEPMMVDHPQDSQAAPDSNLPTTMSWLEISGVPPKHSTKSQLVQFLKGKVLRIPNLEGLFPGWPSARTCNNLYHRLRSELDEGLPMALGDETQRNIARRADPALLAAHIFPLVGYEELKTVAYLVMWLGCWDDLAEDLVEQGDAASWKAFRDCAGFNIMRCFNVYPRKRTDFETFDCIRILEGVVYTLRGAGNRYYIGQSPTFYDSLMEYDESVIKAKRLHRGSKVPTWYAYWKRRLVRGAVHPLLALIEYAHQIPGIDEETTESNEFRTMQLCVHIIVCLINDLFSLKKELLCHPGLRLQAGDQLIVRGQKKGCPVSAMPVIMLNFQVDIDKAVKEITGIISDAVCSFRLAERSVRAQRGDYPELNQVIASLKHICTGFYHWCTETDRYDMSQFRLPDGSFECML